jgi:ABC-type branched-subunit amino acid transport system ATPase component
VHEPEVLIIDELSLGLAPIVVQQVLDVVRRLRDQGMTMIIVEQSLNVALAIADRAIFMEKGQVRFEGPASELAARDDLARAVFLGR